MTKRGHEAPNFDYSASDPQMSIYGEFAHTPEEQQPTEVYTDEHLTTERPEVLVDPSTPESAKPAVEASLEERSFLFDRVDKQGQTTNIGTRERAHIEDADDQEAKERAAARRRAAKSSPRRKPQKSRRGLHGQALSNADGPPPHIPDARKTY